MGNGILSDPAATIVPLLALDESTGVPHFLGTAAFVGEKPMLVTAEHVVRDWSGPFAITTMRDTNRIIPASLVVKNRGVDLALLEVPGYSCEKPLQLAGDNEITSNHIVACYEYSRTETRGAATWLSPATRLGNVTRLLDLTDQYGRAGHNALELSFPALRGASGAPVLSNNNFRLWGVVIANVDYHLLPAQIVSVLDKEDDRLEETRFLLPQALAVHVTHLRAVLESGP